MRAACDVVTVGGMVIGSAVIKEFATTMQVPGDTAPDLDIHPGGYLFLASGEDGAAILREKHSVKLSLGADVVLRGPEALHGGISHPDARNFFFANGYSGHGLQQSPAAGHGVSELITDGGFRALDQTGVGYERIVANRPFLEKAVI